MMTDSEPQERAAEIIATYHASWNGPAREGVNKLAGEMSTGTFVRVPGETPELHRRHQARVISFDALDVDPDKKRSVKIDHGEDGGAEHRIRIGIPWDNVGENVASLLTTVMGNITELKDLTALRLEHLDLPTGFTANQPGPRFGAAGSRDYMGVHGRPMFGSIVKPSIGLAPHDSSALARTLALTGLDFLKDDELQATSAHSPFADRHRHTVQALDDASAQTGRRMPYAFNITGPIDHMRRCLELLNEEQTDIAMVVVPAIGLPALEMLARESAVPIHAHRAGSAALERDTRFGVSFDVVQTLWRLSGADQVHVGGLRSKFYQPDAQVLQDLTSLLTPISPDRDDRVLPVLSSAQTPEHVALTMEEAHTTDFLMLAGGGILAHPDGPAAGVQAFHDAYQKAKAAVPSR